MKKIVTISGSLRQHSLNSELIEMIANQFNALNIDTFTTPTSKLEIPIFNHDLVLSEKLKQGLLEYKNILKSCDGIIISSPEYNGSITGALKNFIDWLSRDINPFLEKKVGLMSVSSGQFGGIRGIMHLRDIMFKLGAFIYPRDICISKKNNTNYSEHQLKLIQEFTHSFANYIQ